MSSNLPPVDNSSALKHAETYTAEHHAAERERARGEILQQALRLLEAPSFVDVPPDSFYAYYETLWNEDRDRLIARAHAAGISF